MARIGIFDDLEPDEEQAQFMPAPIKRGNPNPPVTPPITSKATRPQAREQQFHQPLEVTIPAPQTSVAQQRLGLFDDLEADPAQPQSVNIGAKGDMAPDSRIQPSARAVFTQGPTFNAMDEIQSAAAAPVDMARNYFSGEGPTDFSEAYQQQKARADAQLAATEEYAPWTSAGLELAGALSTGKVPAQWALKGGNMLDKAARSAIVGAGYGAISGFNRGDGIENRLSEANEGAEVGTYFGAVAPGVGRVIGAGVQKSMEWSRGMRDLVGRWIANQKISAPEQRAMKLVAQEMEAAGLDPTTAQFELAKMGREGMIADLAPGLQESAAGVGRLTPEAANIVSQRLAQRRLGGKQRVGQALDQAYGPYRDPYDVQQATKADRLASGALYRAAEGHAVGIDNAANYINAQLKAFPKGPIANSLNQVRDLLTDNAGNFLSEAPQVHAVREQLDDMISIAFRAGESKRGAVLKGLRNRIDEALKTQVPNFAEADNRFASASRQQEAFDRGRTEYFRGGSSTMTPAAAKADFDSASLPVRENIAQGQRAYLEQALAHPRANASVPVDRVLSRDWNMEKTATTIGPERAGKLRSDLDREARFIETSNLAESGRAGQSRTAIIERAAQRLAEGNGVKSDRSVIVDTLASMAGGAVLGGPKGAAIAGLGVGASRAKAAIQRALERKTNPAMYRLFADMLTATDAERDRIIQKLVKEGQETGKKAAADAEAKATAERTGKKAETAGTAVTAIGGLHLDHDAGEDGGG